MIRFVGDTTPAAHATAGLGIIFASAGNGDTWRPRSTLCAGANFVGDRNVVLGWMGDIFLIFKATGPPLPGAAMDGVTTGLGRMFWFCCHWVGEMAMIWLA